MYILYVSNDRESLIAEKLLGLLGYKYRKIKVSPRIKGWLLAEYGVTKTPLLITDYSVFMGLEGIQRYLGFREYRFECGEWNHVSWSPDVLQLVDLWYSSVHGVEVDELKDYCVQKLAEKYGKSEIQVYKVVVGYAYRGYEPEYGIYCFAVIDTDSKFLRKVFDIEVFKEEEIEVIA